MYNIKIEAYFSSAHSLRGYKGKCEELHGHNWKVEVTVEAEKTDKTGMVMDFKDLRKELDRVLDKLDHKCLDRTPYFKKVNPTSENIARYIYKSLQKRLSGLKYITVWESHNSCASYYE
ncbi:MAG: 6-carboxytetrahydropterin synthase QueD [Candidatus Omnitrophota bacterium]|jgi:6-pyruvoyltetrahydropterin/6-carboxytetrahydropterin synthase